MAGGVVVRLLRGSQKPRGGGGGGGLAVQSKLIYQVSGSFMANSGCNSQQGLY